MSDSREHESTSMPPVDGRLRRLAGTPVPSDVERRIVADAMRRLPDKAKPSGSALARTLVPVAAAAIVALGLWFYAGQHDSASGGNVSSPQPTKQPVSQPASRVSSTPSKNRAEPTTRFSKPGRYAVGPHHIELVRGHGRWVSSKTKQTTSVALEAGRARFSVRPLSKGVFKVATQHLEVTVIGTVFSVSVDDECSQVEVVRGQVAVRAKAAPENAAAPILLERHGIHTICRLPSTPERLSRLEQVLRDGLSALRRGELVNARRMITRYLAAKPRGPLAAEALFQLVLLEKRLGHRARVKKLRAMLNRRFAASTYPKRLERLLGPMR